MITLKEYNGLCWWCGNLADSQEHLHKKTDFKRVFKEPPYDEDNQPMRVISNIEQRIIQGPNSKEIKFSKVLCKKCNNARSQQFDKAYDKFIEWVEKNTLQIIDKEIIDFSLIFGSNWLEEKKNVLKYYIKHFCCRLAENNVSISDEIIDFIEGRKNLEHLIIKFEIRFDILALFARNLRQGKEASSLYKGKMEYLLKEEVDNEFDLVTTFYNYRWFRTIFQYSERVNTKDKHFDWYQQYNQAKNISVKTYSILPPEKYETCSDEEIYQLIEEKEIEDTEEDNFEIWLGIK